MRKIAPLILALAAVAYFFLPSGDDPRQIDAIFGKIEEAGVKRDLDGVFEHFSLLYKDDYGATYPALKGIVKRFFEKYDGFDAGYSNLAVSIGEDSDGKASAVANLDVYISGIKSGRDTPIVGNEGSPENITVTLEKSGLGDWKIVNIEGLESAEDGF
ncbi:MAG: hypothetical protein ACT4NX_06465 [Deltaproteobacteria bacterium]